MPSSVPSHTGTPQYSQSYLLQLLLPPMSSSHELFPLKEVPRQYESALSTKHQTPGRPAVAHRVYGLGFKPLGQGRLSAPSHRHGSLQMPEPCAGALASQKTFPQGHTARQGMQLPYRVALSTLMTSGSCHTEWRQRIGRGVTSQAFNKAILKAAGARVSADDWRIVCPAS